MSEENPKSALDVKFTRRHWAGLCVMLLLVTAASLFYWARFESYSVCRECALRREAVAWEVPFVHRTIYERSQLHDSALSEVIRVNELVGHHEHDWDFVFGSGNGSPMVFGATRSIASILTSDTAGSFLGEVMKHSGKDQARQWLASFQDESQAEWCRCIAESLQGQTFEASLEFDAWLADAIERNREFIR